MQDTNIFIFLAHSEESIHIALSKLSYQQFSIMFLPSPWPSKVLATVHGLVYNHRIAHLVISLPCKWIARCTVQNSARWEDFSLPLPFSDVPAKVYSTSAIHFLVMPAYCEEPSISKTQVSRLVGAKRQCSRNGTIGIFGQFFMKIPCALRTCSGLITYPFDDRVFLCTSKFMV